MGLLQSPGFFRTASMISNLFYGIWKVLLARARVRKPLDILWSNRIINHRFIEYDKESILNGAFCRRIGETT
jgi:hypothetical protein